MTSFSIWSCTLPSSSTSFPFPFPPSAVVETIFTSVWLLVTVPKTFLTPPDMAEGGRDDGALLLRGAGREGGPRLSRKTVACWTDLVRAAKWGLGTGRESASEKEGDNQAREGGGQRATQFTSLVDDGSVLDALGPGRKVEGVERVLAEGRTGRDVANEQSDGRATEGVLEDPRELRISVGYAREAFVDGVDD